jgi:hypothetical protein
MTLTPTPPLGDQLPVYEENETVLLQIRARIIGTDTYEDGSQLLTYSYLDAELSSSVVVPANAETVMGAPVVVHRLVPAAGMPQPGEVWQDKAGRRWFAVPTRDGVRLTNDGITRSDVTSVHRQYGPIRPVHQLAENGGQP